MSRGGHKEKNINGVNNLLIDFKPNRCDSSVYMNFKVDVTKFVKFMDDLKKKNPDLTYFHGMSFILGQVLYSRPYMNRFIQNRTMYMHDDVSISFVAKAEFKDESMEYLTVLKFDENDNLLDVSRKLKEKVNKIREKKSSHDGANDIVGKIGMLPKIFRVPIVGFFKWMDKHGILPKSVIEDNIYYSSAIVSNLGTFKVGAIYHNLTNFGTSSSLITFGEITKEGNKYYLEVGATIDERIADGFYFCKALKLMEYIYQNPELMLNKVSEKVSIKK